MLPEFGARSQKRLKASRVLVIGAGGLGAPAAMYLAAAGVGTLGLVDFDVVDLSNLQRQLLHGTPDVGRPKLDSAKDTLNRLNPEVAVRTHALHLSADNALALFAEYDVILDGTDNYATRYLVNDACGLLKKPYVSASVFRFEGQLSVFGAPQGPCYRCLYPEPPPAGLVPSCGEGGVLGVVPGVLGTLQATEAVKVVCGIGDPLVGRMLVFDALDMTFRTLKVRRNPSCALCGDAPTVTGLIDYQTFCGLNAPPPEQVSNVSPEWLSQRLASKATDIVLVDVREPGERDINAIAGSKAISLADLPSRYTEIDSTKEVVLYCKVGERSARAAVLLKRFGFERVHNLEGGIERWLDEVDDDQPRY